MQNDLFFLNSILVLITELEGFRKDPGSEHTKKTAIKHNIALIGEAVNKLTPALRERYNTIPWVKISGTRNRIIHGYFTVDDRLIDEIVEEHLEPLKTTITTILHEMTGAHHG